MSRAAKTAAAPVLRDRLRAQLADLKMPGALEALDEILRAVDGGTLAAGEALEAVLGAQIALRNARRLQTAMRSARLPAVKTLADFDFSFQPSVKREQLESLHTLDFLERRENVILLGPPGVGKTHCQFPAVPLTRLSLRGYAGGSGGRDDPKTHRPCGWLACLCQRYVSRPSRHRLHAVGLA